MPVSAAALCFASLAVGGLGFGIGSRTASDHALTSAAGEHARSASRITGVIAVHSRCASGCDAHRTTFSRLFCR